MRLTTRWLSVALCLAGACGEDSATEASGSLATVYDAGAPAVSTCMAVDSFCGPGTPQPKVDAGLAEPPIGI
jgi:hypothetical protein